MTDVRAFIPRSAVDAVLQVQKTPNSLGRAALLYLALLSAASNRGVAIRTRAVLAKELASSGTDLDRWLARLQNAGLILVESSSVFLYLVIKIRFWSGGGLEGAEAAASGSSESSSSQYNVPVSSSKQHAAAARVIKNSNAASGDGVQGEGSDLLAEARKIVGADDDRLDELLAEYDESVIRRALARVQATPDRQIRKSRLALFRYLLAKFTSDSND